MTPSPARCGWRVGRGRRLPIPAASDCSAARKIATILNTQKAHNHSQYNNNELYNKCHNNNNNYYNNSNNNNSSSRSNNNQNNHSNSSNSSNNRNQHDCLVS